MLVDVGLLDSLIDQRINVFSALQMVSADSDPSIIRISLSLAAI